MLIISASNVARTAAASRSLRIARLLGDAVGGAELIDLRDYGLRSCDMCEGCAEDGRCVQPDDFNAVKAALDRHDDVAVVCPHYAGIPSKLVALFEKLEEGAYLSYCSGRPPAKKKRFGAIAHGGMTSGYEDLYTENLSVPLRNMARSLGWTVVSEGAERQLCVGVLRYTPEKDSGGVCFRKDDDEEGARAAVRRLAGLFSAPVG